MKNVGVLAIQGDVAEHVRALEAAAGKDSGFRILEVKTREAIRGLDALVIPGGESTTIGKLIKAYGVDGAIKELALSGKPVLGTCAGSIILAKEGDFQVERTGQKLLGVIDVKVSRNAFGRQRESFEAPLSIPLLGEKPYAGVFIRAPAIERVWGCAEVLCEFEDKIVAAMQGRIIVTAFHPELSSDPRLHEFFLGLV